MTRVTKRKKPTNLTHLAPVLSSKNQQESEYDTVLPKELVFVSTSINAKYHNHVDFSGWAPTDAVLLRLLTVPTDSSTSYKRLTLDHCTRISSVGLRCLTSAVSLRQLSLRGCHALTPDAIGCFPVALTALDLSHSGWVDDAALRLLARRCIHLRTVVLVKCKRLTDYGVAAFGEIVKPAMTSVDVSHCPQLTDTALLVLLLKLPALQTLVASGLPLVEGLSLQALPRISNSSQHLQRLDLSGNSGMQALTTVYLIRTVASRLVELNLSDCAQTTDDAPVALGRYCPTLRCLRLAFCSLVTDFGLQRLVEFIPLSDGGGGESHADFVANDETLPRCVHLQTLEVTGCFCVTNATLVSLAHHCVDLQTLTLDGVRRITSIGLHAVLQQCRRLRSLSWNGILVKGVDSAGRATAFFSIPHVDALAVSALSAAPASLQTLELGNTMCDVDALAKLLSRTDNRLSYQLTDLNVTSIATDALCITIGTFCRNLQMLRLCRSRYFSETSFLVIAQGCRRLRCVDLESCEQIRDDALVALSKGCSETLEKLVLANDWQVTDQGVTRLGAMCPRLTSLNVRHCPEVSLRALQRIAAQNPLVDASPDGLAPKHYNVVAFLKKAGERDVAARRITRWLRTRLQARSRPAHLLQSDARKFLRLRTRGAIKIQRCYRQFHMRRAIAQVIAARHERVEYLWQWMMAVCVLRRLVREFVWKRRAQRRLDALRAEEKRQIRREQAAITIQSISRGWLARRRAAQARVDAAKWRELQGCAAVTIQRVTRGYWSRQSTRTHRQVCEAALLNAVQMMRVHIISTLHLQRASRGFFGRQRSKKRAAELHELMLRQQQSAATIQRAYRAHFARVALRNLLFKGATALQKLFRGFCGRRDARTFVLAHAFVCEPRILIFYPHTIYIRELAVQWKFKRDAALVIALNLQCAYRGYIGRLRFRLQLAQMRQLQYLRDVSAKVLQHFFRSIIILVRLESLKFLLRLRRRSATKIQATLRMWLGKVAALAFTLQRDRRRQHHMLLVTRSGGNNISGCGGSDTIAPDPTKLHFLQFGAVHVIVSLYRESLLKRGWQSPTFVQFLHRSATTIQKVVRGHLGREYTKWHRQHLTTASRCIQCAWRGKRSRDAWRALMLQRALQQKLAEEENRSAQIAQKQSNQYARGALERETRHALILQGWYRTLRQRQIFTQARNTRKSDLEQRAKEKLALVMKMSTESVVFQARVWRDCVENKQQLLSLEEDQCVAMEEEIAKLHKECLTTYVTTIQASTEYDELMKHKNDFVRSRKKRSQDTEEVKARIHPFAVQAKKLTMESARVYVENKQLQSELRRMRSCVAAFHKQLRESLPMEPLLFQSDIDRLLTLLELPNEQSSLITQELQDDAQSFKPSDDRG